MPLNRDQRAIFDYALRHLRNDQSRLDALIETTRAALGSAPRIVPAVPDAFIPDWVLSASEKVARTTAEKPARKKRRLSAKARASIAAAQKKRWEAFHAEEKVKTTTPSAKKKRGKKVT